jgi:hypothetical protein
MRSTRVYGQELVRSPDEQPDVTAFCKCTYHCIQTYIGEPGSLRGLPAVLLAHKQAPDDALGFPVLDFSILWMNEATKAVVR